MMKPKAIVYLLLTCFLHTGHSLFAYAAPHGETGRLDSNENMYVAAYVWPSCHDDTISRELLWQGGEGEWEIIKQGTPRFDGHYQPKEPLWGYEMDNDPNVMERWIDAATDHGVNVFIFDWYWYGNGPFLESTLNDGFLKARNNDKMQFYIMWANHDVPKNYWNVHRYRDDNSLLWNGAVDWENFKVIVNRTINQYFIQSNYFKIAGEPVFSIFNINELIESFGSIEESRKALDYFREEVKKKGFPDLHIQLILRGDPNQNMIDWIDELGAKSVTWYNWGGPFNEDYIRWGVKATERWDSWSSALSIPVFPNVSIGWDDSPRFPHKTQQDIVHYNKSPVSFASFLQKAKIKSKKVDPKTKLITIFSWNEWIEGGYLLPDMKYGFEYLKAVKQVMVGDYDQYKNE